MKWKDFEKDGYVKLDELATFYDEKSKLYKTTQGYQMVRNFVLDQVLSEEFQRKVLEIRKIYSVPNIGYKYPGAEEMDEQYFPAGRFVPPAEWSPANTEGLNTEINKLARSWGLHPNGWYEFFMNYIIYDEIILPDYPETNLCLVKEIRDDDEEIEEWKKDDDWKVPQI